VEKKLKKKSRREIIKEIEEKIKKETKKKIKENIEEFEKKNGEGLQKIESEKNSEFEKTKIINEMASYSYLAYIFRRHSNLNFYFDNFISSLNYTDLINSSFSKNNLFNFFSIYEKKN